VAGVVTWVGVTCSQAPVDWAEMVIGIALGALTVTVWAAGTACPTK
jgi:hypothetical protein